MDLVHKRSFADDVEKEMLERKLINGGVGTV